ncbi:MAG TPA: SDR family oxidoreductase [Candidatus Caldiarchaeum subterraneum]|uniref:SDR family oxidoreductase n=1 Tax=Caldiarchaeum subterraneum TaxID=311458 RepID=A0A833A5B5_CALS0|nr:SDR family oxidoreductase [Aigarchaeota archaeon]HIQ30288.1 SDR family oxidoreductase [Candidatus Caldarchaeum subterraneum]
MLYDIRGKVAVVTGSGRGIGRAIAVKLAHEGASAVVVNAKKGREEAEETARIIKAAGSSSIAVVCDVATPHGAAELISEAAAKYGRVDILVNNVGVGLYRRIGEYDEGVVEKIIATSLKSAIYCSQEAVKRMRGEGVIVNVSSLVGFIPYQGLAIYSAAKAGLIGLTKAMAVDLAPGIRVNAVAPGLVMDTKIGESWLKLHNITPEDWKTRYTLLRRPVYPDEVAEAVATLIKIPSITGETIVIDAGQSLLPGRFLE